jgi:hypothetical protein
MFDILAMHQSSEQFSCVVDFYIRVNKTWWQRLLIEYQAVQSRMLVWSEAKSSFVSMETLCISMSVLTVVPYLSAGLQDQAARNCKCFRSKQLESQASGLFQMIASLMKRPLRGRCNTSALCCNCAWQTRQAVLFECVNRFRIVNIFIPYIYSHVVMSCVLLCTSAASAWIFAFLLTHDRKSHFYWCKVTNLYQCTPW